MKGRGLSNRHLFSLVMLLAFILIGLLSLGSTIRTYAMPVEARTTDIWYSYKSSLGFDFTANVTQSRQYPSAKVSARDLIRNKMPVDPSVYRRALISKLVNSIEIQIPYSYKADRPAPATAKLRVDGSLVLPGVWEKPYPLVGLKEFKLNGPELSGTETFTIPVAKFLADMDEDRKSLGMSVEPLEVHIRPALEVTVEGLREPVSVLNTPEFVAYIRQTTVEVDDPRDAKVDKTLSETHVVPITISFLGRDVAVSTVRFVSLAALCISLVLGALLLLRRRKRPDARTLLQKLGPNLISARTFELPPDTAIADVRTVKEFIQLQSQTERPVIKVGTQCYLLDGTTCYRFILADQESVTAAVVGMADESLADLAHLVNAEAFTLDPWITEIHVSSAQDMLHIHAATGRMVIRTANGYHLLDGSVCYTYRPALAEAQAEASAEAPYLKAAPAEQDQTPE